MAGTKQKIAQKAVHSAHFSEHFSIAGVPAPLQAGSTAMEKLFISASSAPLMSEANGR